MEIAASDPRHPAGNSHGVSPPVRGVLPGRCTADAPPGSPGSSRLAPVWNTCSLASRSVGA